MVSTIASREPQAGGQRARLKDLEGNRVLKREATNFSITEHCGMVLGRGNQGVLDHDVAALPQRHVVRVLVLQIILHLPEPAPHVDLRGCPTGFGIGVNGAGSHLSAGGHP